MFRFELNNHPMLLGLPEEVDQSVLEATALAVAEDALKGGPGCAAESPQELAQGIVNALLQLMPDDVIEPADWDDTSGHCFKLAQPVSKDVVLEALAANPAAILLHPPVDVDIRTTVGFDALNVAGERIDALVNDAVEAVVFSGKPHLLTRHRWGKHAFVIFACLNEKGVNLIFALPDEWNRVVGCDFQRRRTPTTGSRRPRKRRKQR